MKWNICGVLLVVVAVTAGKVVRELNEDIDLRIDNNMITTIDWVSHEIKLMELASASWYCYEFSSEEEKPIAMSEVAKFAGGANKEGKVIQLSSLQMLAYPSETSLPGSIGRYCVLASPSMIDPDLPANKVPLTPNNDKIKYKTLNATRFYAANVFNNDATSTFKKLKVVLHFLGGPGTYAKVDFDHPTLIFAKPGDRALVLYPAKDNWS